MKVSDSGGHGKADIDAAEVGGKTALHAAVENDHGGMMGLSIRVGAGPEAADKSGLTPHRLAKARLSSTLYRELRSDGHLKRPRCSLNCGLCSWLRVPMATCAESESMGYHIRHRPPRWRCLAVLDSSTTCRR